MSGASGKTRLPTARGLAGDVRVRASERQAEAEVGGAPASSGDRRGVRLGYRVAMGRGSGTFERLLGNAAPAPRWERPTPLVLPGDRRATPVLGGRARRRRKARRSWAQGLEPTD